MLHNYLYGPKLILMYDLSLLFWNYTVESINFSFTKENQNNHNNG